MGGLANPEALLSIVVVAIAGWRITHFLVNEDGPFDFMDNIRTIFGVDWGYDSDHKWVSFVSPDGPWWHLFFGGILNCFYCCSFWVAIVFFVLMVLFPNMTVFLSIPLVLSSMMIWIEEKNNGESN